MMVWSFVRAVQRGVQAVVYPPSGWWVCGYVTVTGEQKWLVADPARYDRLYWETLVAAATS